MLWEFHMWHRDSLPVLLLIPWSSLMTEPVMICGPRAVEGSITLPIPLNIKQREEVLSAWLVLSMMRSVLFFSIWGLKRSHTC